MQSKILQELTGRGAIAVLGILIGVVCTWLFGRWRRHKERQRIFKGDAHETIVIEHHLVETADGPEGKKVPAILRMRSLGQGQLNHVVPNGHLATELFNRACQVTPRHTLISMEGSEGSYLLETLTNFVCDRVSGTLEEHDLYVMTPICEPAGVAVYEPITIILISVTDLPLFETWQACLDVQVEHGSDGARVLTLMELAQRYRAEQEQIAACLNAGQPISYMECSYILDLALDKRSADIPVMKIPWDRFEDVLKQMDLESINHE